MKTAWLAAMMWMWWFLLLAGLGTALFLHTRIQEERALLAAQVPRISKLSAFEQSIKNVPEGTRQARARGVAQAELARRELHPRDRGTAEAGDLVAALSTSDLAYVQGDAQTWADGRVAAARTELSQISVRLESLWSAMFSALIGALVLAVVAATVALVRHLRLGSSQRRVRQLDHVLRSLLGGAPVGLFAMDRAGRLQVLAGAITSSWRSTGSPDAPAWERLAENVSLAQALKSGHERGELSTSASVGDRRLDLSFSRVTDSHASDLYTLGIAVDLSARVAPREDVRFAEDEERFESLGSIAGGIAHEFNNLLVGILGYAHLAGLEDGTPPAVHRHLSRIEDSGKRAGHIVQKLMASAGHAPTNVESVRLADLVHEALDSIALPESVQLDEHVMRHQAVAFADPAQIRIVVRHLVDNAIEAIGSSNEGRITVRTGQHSYSRSELGEARAASPTLVAGTYAYIEVSDSGSGMDEATESHMFNPYFSTRFPGRGLGLSAVYGIVRRHHGAVFVRTAAGKGTIVRVALPAEPPPARRRKEPEAARGKAGTVLVIEQDRPIQAYVNAALKRRGFEVIRATDGVEALSIYAQRVGTIDVVLLDATLRDPDTETVLHDIRARKRDQAIVLMGLKGLRPPTTEPGTARVGWLNKPFKVEALLRAVRGLIPIRNGHP